MSVNNDKEIEKRINKEIDRCGLAYKVMDNEGNIFVFGGIENGCAWYRSNGGPTHIFSLQGYNVIQQYCKLD